MALLRVKLARGAAARWLTPREFLLSIHEAVAKANLPVKRRGGARSHFRITPGPPLRPGHLSRCEYVDFELCVPMAAVEFGRRLDEALPEGLEVLWQKRMPPRTPTIKAAVKSFAYTIEFVPDPEKAAAFDRAESWPLKQFRKNRERVLDLKQSISYLELQPDKVIVRIKVRGEGTPKPEEVIASIFGIPPDEVMQFPTERTDMRLAPSHNPRASAMEYL